MPKVWIPRCGDGIRLAKPWTAILLSEHRNVEMYRVAAGLPSVGSRWSKDAMPQRYTVTFRAGTELVFDRVYIRQGADSFASVTFIVKDDADGKLVGQRFWVTVDNANEIEADLTSTGNKLGPFALRSYVTAWQGKADPTVLERAARAKLKRNELANVHAACYEASCTPWPRDRRRIDKRPRDVIDHHNAIVQAALPAALLRRDAEHAEAIAAATAWNNDRKSVSLLGEQTVRTVSDAEVLKGIEHCMMQGYNGKNSAWTPVATRKLPDGVTERDMLCLNTWNAPAGATYICDLGWTVTTNAEGAVSSIRPFAGK